jgi:PAS domain S-box-containing protein
MMTTATGSTISSFLDGGGEMGELIRSYDWTGTSLGPPEEWPQSLRSVLSICLASNFPIAIYWGNDLTLFYNDAWSTIAGNKHPWALGKKAIDVWPEIWNDIQPQFQKAFNGESGGSKDALLPMHRHGYTEECYFDFTFTPVYGEAGKVEGIFNTVIETSYRVINETRSDFLNRLTLSLSGMQSQSQAIEKLIRFLQQNNQAISFGMFYGLTAAGPELIASTFSDHDFPLSNVFPFENTYHSGKLHLISDLRGYFAEVPKGFWPEAPAEAVIIPLKNAKDEIRNFVVCGLNARRRFDNIYATFFESLSTLLTNVFNSISSVQLELSINSRTVGIWHWDVRKNIMTWSREQFEIFDVSSNEFSGRAEDFFDRVLDEDREKVYAASKLEFERSENQYEFRIRRKNGAIRWIQSKSKTVSGASGEPEYIMGINMDISEQKAAEEKLSFAATLVDNITDAIIGTDIADHEYRITSWNKGAEAIYGWKASEVIGRPVAEILKTAAHTDEVRRSKADQIRAEGHISEEVVQKHKDGRLLNIHASVTLIKDEKGNGIGAVAVNRDITEKKKIEQAYRNTKEQLEMTVKNIPSGVYQFNSKGKLEYINQRGAELMGYNSIEEVIACNDLEHLRQHMHNSFLVLDESGNPLADEDGSTYRAFTTGKYAEVVTQFIHKDTGKIFWLLSNSCPLYNKKGELSYVLTTVTDITTQKIAEHRVRESEQYFRSSKEQLEQTFKSIPAGVYLVGPMGEMLFANDIAAKMIDFASPEEMIAMKDPSAIGAHFSGIFDVFDENGESLTLENTPIFKTLSTHQPAEAVIKVVRRKNGIYYWVLSRSTPLFNEDGSISRVLVISNDVTQQKIAEQKIKLSEENFRDTSINLERLVKQRTEELTDKNRQLNEAQQIAKLGSWEWDPVTNEVKWSDEMYVIYGYEERGFPLTYEKAMERMLPIYRASSIQKAKQEMADALDIFKKAGERKHDNSPTEFEIELPGGRRKVLKGIAQILLSETGEVAKVSGTVQDVTNEKEYDRALRLINRQLSEAQHIAQLGSWEWNVLTNDLHWSDNLYNIYGIEPGEIINFDKFIVSVHPGDRGYVQKILESSRKEKQFQEFYHRIITPAGAVKTLHARGETILNAEGEVVKIIGTSQDVTAQKNIEDKLIDTNEKLEQRNAFVEKLINSSLDLIMVVDKKLRFLTLNKKAESVLQSYYPGKIVGKKVTEINPGIENTDSFRDLLNAFDGEIIIRNKVKSTISDNYYEHNYVPLTDASGDVYAVMIISHDITENIHQMEALKKLNESDQLKSDFIKMASHELKTPVTSAKGYVQLLLSAMQKDQEKPLSPSLIKLSLVSIDKQISKLTRLLSELLDLSKIEAGKLELHKEVFNLNELVIETVQDVLYSNAKHDINIFHNFGCEVYGDKDRIGQVLINLLTNAIKYSPNADRVEVWIERASNGNVAVSVKDQGIGIDRQYHDKIFERFYRVQGKEEQTFPGFGIGLFIAKEVLLQHDSSITFTSEKGKGSVFTFNLPVAR